MYGFSVPVYNVFVVPQEWAPSGGPNTNHIAPYFPTSSYPLFPNQPFHPLSYYQWQAAQAAQAVMSQQAVMPQQAVPSQQAAPPPQQQQAVQQQQQQQQQQVVVPQAPQRQQAPQAAEPRVPPLTGNAVLDLILFRLLNGATNIEEGNDDDMDELDLDDDDDEDDEDYVDDDDDSESSLLSGTDLLLHMRLHTVVSVAQAESECAVCQEPIRVQEITRRLRCRHLFHMSCVDRAIEQTPSCPLCRQSIMP